MFQGKVFDLARQGDGLLRQESKNIFISGVLPDETVVFDLTDDHRARLIEVIDPSPDRADPVCSCFQKCGGCALQHLKPEAYQRFKMRWLREVFREIPDFDPPVFIPFNTRRRVTFALFWKGKARRFGFNEKQSDRIVETDGCSVLVEDLNKLILPLRRYFTDPDHFFPKKSATGDVFVQMTDNGADILVTLPFDPDLQWRQSAAVFAQQNDIARISWRFNERSDPEPLVTLRTPEIKIGDFTLNPPAGSFLQPSVAGQNALIAAVTEYAGKAKKVCDLFCGAGTFSLSLLQKKRTIKGVDNVSQALEALRLASEGRVETEQRDLFKTPLYPDELENFDTVVFDPPRAGAKAQCEQLAVSSVPRVIAVSCNPTSFVRDAEILTNGGYRLKRLRPVDQFAFTPHMELVALFEK